MSAQLNHTIVWCRDKQRSTHFLTQILNLPNPVPFGPMLVVELANGVSLDFVEKDNAIAKQHYAFLLDEEEFDEAFARIRDQGLHYCPSMSSTKGTAARAMSSVASGTVATKPTCLKPIAPAKPPATKHASSEARRVSRCQSHRTNPACFNGPLPGPIE
jgi:hypothetical protein